MSRSETRAAVASQGQPGPGTRAGQWRRNPALAGLVVLALLLGACGPTAPAPAAKSGAQEPPAPAAPAGPSSAAGAGTTAAAPAPAAAEPRRVRITIPSLSGTAIHYYIARDEGFFARRGIDADISVISAALGLKALVAGEFEFAGAVGTSVSAALTDA